MSIRSSRRRAPCLILTTAFVGCCAFAENDAFAAQPDPDPAPAPDSQPDNPQTPTPTTAAPIPKAPDPPLSPATPATPVPAPGSDRRLRVDPVADGAVLGVSAGFAGVLDLVTGTGEVRPQQISSTFDYKSLLGIDRGAVSQHVDPNAATYSNIGAGVAIGYVALDVVLSGIRADDARASLIDGMIYAETAAITLAATNIAKLAVRRPRPLAYVAANEHKNDPNYSNSDTDSSLSFYSGHASLVASLSATATYLAYIRSPKGSVRPWITLIAGAALTSFVSFERVRAGKHFPTDVIAGSLAGAGIGVLVPHLHRVDPRDERVVWLAAAPAPSSESGALAGGTVSLNGLF